MCKTKICTNCNESKELDSFPKNKAYEDGRNLQCKECLNIKRRLRNLNRLDREYKEDGLKVCTLCKITKPFSCFCKSIQSLDGRGSQCKECKKKYYAPTRINIIIFPNECKRVCTKCKEVKDFSDFNKNSKNSLGITSVCKVCKKEHRLKYKTLYKIIPTLKKCTKCKVLKPRNDFVRDSSKSDGLSCSCKLCTSERSRNRFSNDYMYRVSTAMRRAITTAFKKHANGKIVKKGRTEEILKTSFLELLLNIEKQFISWMSWDKYGVYSGNFNEGFDIDHIIPISYAKTEEELHILNHWSNFQPLCSKNNRDIKKATVYPCTNLELGITFWEDYYEYINIK